MGNPLDIIPLDIIPRHNPPYRCETDKISPRHNTPDNSPGHNPPDKMLHRHGPRAVLSLAQGLTILLVQSLDYWFFVLAVAADCFAS